MKLYIYILIFFAYSCTNSINETKVIQIVNKEKKYAKEPADSSLYKHLKFSFYQTSDGQIYERKLAFNEDSNYHFTAFYDNIWNKYDENIKLLKDIIDINSYAEIDSTEYSKDKNRVYYFHSNSDGGIRGILENADPKTFKRLCEYRWGIDKNHVYYEGILLKYLDTKNVIVLYSKDTSNQFINYIKDKKKVYFTDEEVKEADAKTFKLVLNKNWDAEDKNYKYKFGKRL